jgi:hypothetical protein
MSKTTVVGAVAPKLDMKVLSGQVDRLGTIRAEKGVLEKEEKEVKKVLSEVLAKKGDTLAGRKFEATVIVPDARIPNNKKLIKKLGIDWFIENATVALGVLEDKLGNEDLDAVITLVTEGGSPQIRTKKL